MNNWLYEHNEDNSARYILGELGTNMLTCFGINPSRAVPENLDPTLKQVKQRSIMHGYDGWMMFNVYPQRAPDPKDLHSEIDVYIHKENLKVIKEFFSKYDCDIWAAWGTLINKRKYFKNCLGEIVSIIGETNNRWINIGDISKMGHPHHPLYLSYEKIPRAFNMGDYLNKN